MRLGIERQDEMGNWTVRHAVEGGYAQRHWLFSQLEDGGADTSGYRTEGVYLELRSEPMRLDSLWSFQYGVRHVDPGFRSGGAQTRRLDLGGSVPLMVYPTYSDEVLDRPVAMFDLMASDGVYNQMLSATLMDFHPAYSNVLPYGDATPNRQGAFLEVSRRHAQGEWEVQLDGGVFREIIGQGTPDLRQYNHLAGRLAWRAGRTLGLDRTVDLTVGADVEETSRTGEPLAAVDLSRRVLDVSANVEVADRLFLQGASSAWMRRATNSSRSAMGLDRSGPSAPGNTTCPTTFSPLACGTPSATRSMPMSNTVDGGLPRRSPST